MTEYTVFYIDKSNRTFADELLMCGWARVVTLILDYQRKETANLTVRDSGAYYHITCPAGIDDSLFDPRNTVFPISMIRTPKNGDTIPSDMWNAGNEFDYEAAKEATNFFYEARKKGMPADQIPEKPRHWERLRAINPAALPGYNALVSDFWRIRTAQPQILTLLCQLFSSTPNDIDTAVEQWKTLDKANGWGIKSFATCQQLFNPDQGKGQNRVKSDGLSIGNLDGFWLIEWLKAVGFFEIGLTRLVQGAKDRKTFVISPRELTYDDHRAIFSRFVDTMTSETSIRFDILASIRYTQTLLEHFNQSQGGLARLLGLRQVKKKVVAGFQTAFYKDLGNATATMNVSFIALPGWVEIQAQQDVSTYIALLEELDKVTRQFDESHSDAFRLLQYLRDFISGDDLSAFFRFTNAFPAYYMGMREHNKYAYALSTIFIERLMMSTDKSLSRILESEGFQNIAYAIRRSTITAQYRKKAGDRMYDVRYGLGQELARKARYPQDFIVALSDFLQKYNAENAQIAETRGKQFRRNIRTSDIDEIVRLIDDYGSEPVANLLIAYGYASDREDQPEQQNAQEEG
jgi:hypothetical protein